MEENISEKRAFLREWGKIWNWIVFVFGLLKQMGGVRGVMKALGQAIMIPIARGFRHGSDRES